ncbi:diacylglycerol kinase [Desulfatitalea alkaliphila]|uniref:Diacylglycerol kinase n=1 Tax=Desulfatitalea alkaliphila TaxID=2929485 RepID=A0AA41UK97_9BACT|nr:diacylglycerol kinase [Desulfatitalea alkaliphila]MCJ8502815.1 diacylglycerol kinase [Desulfatitalea alkaliphila]
MSRPHRGMVQHWIDATRWSLQGLAAAWRNEAAFRQEVVAVVLLLPVAFWLGETAVQRALLAAVLLLVPLVELINSAIEAVVDRIGLEHHPLSGRAKNLGSAAVLMVLVLAAVVWGLIAWERFF